MVVESQATAGRDANELSVQPLYLTATPCEQKSFGVLWNETEKD